MGVRATAGSSERLTRGRVAARWFGIVGPPSAAFAHQQLSYVLTDEACTRQAPLLMYVPVILALGLIAWAAVLDWREWQVQSGRRRGGANGAGAARFFGAVGLALSGLAAGLVLAQWLPTVFLHPCQR